MVRKLASLLMMSLILCIVLTGCWDSGDIEKHNNISLVIVDFHEDQYRILVEIANIFGAGGQKDSGSVRYSVLEASADSIIATRDELNRRCDFPIFLGATRAVVFTQSMAEKGIEEYINRLGSDVEYRKSVPLFTSVTEPQQMIYDLPENAHSIGDAIQDTSTDQEKNGQTITVNAGDIRQILALKNVGFLLPQMNIEEDENTLAGYSVFKDAKCIGIIPITERQGLIYLLGRKPHFNYEVYYDHNKYNFDVILTKKKIQAQLIDGKVTFDIDMSFKCKFQYMAKNTDFTGEQKKHLTERLTEKLEEDLQSTLKESQITYGCDYLEFYKYFRARYLTEFKKMNWEEQYRQADMKVYLDAKIVGIQ